MTNVPLEQNYRRYVAIYRCDVVSREPFVVVCDDVKVELFREDRTYFPAMYPTTVLAAVLHAEYRIPVHPPVPTEGTSYHLVLTTRTRLDREEAQPSCEAAIDRVIALLSAVLSPDLFRLLVFRGWLRGPATPNLGALIRFIEPIEVPARELPKVYGSCSSAVARNPALGDRFALLSRFVAKGLAEPPGEEAFVWLWTALEIFPMVNTTDIAPISELLAPYIGHPASVVKEKLKIGWLFGMRSRLVHDGHLPLDDQGKFSALAALERLVRAVIRCAAGLPYDGSFDFAIQPK